MANILKKIFTETEEIPVHYNQIISQQGTLGLGPEDMDETASLQIFIHVKRVSQLIDCLGRASERTQTWICTSVNQSNSVLKQTWTGSTLKMVTEFILCSGE